MPRNPEPEATPEKRSLKKGAGLLLSISVLGFLCFLAIVFWINYPKPRLQPEPLSPELKTIVDHIPGKTDALIYIGLKDIRQSSLWQKIIPDSLKKAPLFQPKGQLNTLMKAANINPAVDIDTLLSVLNAMGTKSRNIWELPGALFRRNYLTPFSETTALRLKQSVVIGATHLTAPSGSARSAQGKWHSQTTEKC